MIYVVTCTCGGADRTAREALRNGGVENPIEYPIYKGKKEAKAVVTQLISRFGPSADLGALLDYIEKAGRFVVVIGVDTKTRQTRWADLSRGSIKEKLDGEIIVKEFKDR